MTTNSAGPPALPDLESFAALVRAARSCRRFKPEPRPSRDDLAALRWRKSGRVSTALISSIP